VDTVARFGGDEFVVLAEETTAVEGEELIHRLPGALAVAIPTDSTTLRITVSVGMATVTADTPDAEQVLQRADAAMYRAKRCAG
jgi:diguanylate cyclase (GGDEF)-like protein